jgi:tetraacyldisaccharide 4'-kinase
MALRARLQSGLVEAWQKRGVTARALYPLALVHRLWRGLSRGIRRVGLLSSRRLPVPVVVVGNLYVGGTGKTPLTIEIVRALKQRGWQPGVVSRGYRGRVATPQVVNAQSSARELGDEPLLISRSTSVPVAVGRDRVGAARLLLNLFPQCNVGSNTCGWHAIAKLQSFTIEVLAMGGCYQPAHCAILRNGLMASTLLCSTARRRSYESIRRSFA